MPASFVNISTPSVQPVTFQEDGMYLGIALQNITKHICEFRHILGISNYGDHLLMLVGVDAPEPLKHFEESDVVPTLAAQGG